jgi:NADPH:quinone reductase-like Zn-dependent oxidoreductase
VVPSFFQSWLSGPATEARLAGALGGPLDGVMAERMLLPAAGVVAMPEHLSFAEAAAYPCAGVTAWSAVFRHGAVRPGQSVLIQGTGGVALFALQFAKMAGARVIAISSTDEKLERLRALGADHGINYRTTEKWGRLAAEMAGGDGVDLVVELGGGGTFAQSLRAVRTGGAVALIGVLGGAAPELNLPLVVMRDLRLQGVTVGSRDDLAAMFDAVGQHRSRPVIDRRFALGDLRQALDYLQSGAHVGKVAIDIDIE